MDHSPVTILSYPYGCFSKTTNKKKWDTFSRLIENLCTFSKKGFISPRKRQIKFEWNFRVCTDSKYVSCNFKKNATLNSHA